MDRTDPDRSFGLSLGETLAVTAVPSVPDGVLTPPGEAWLRLVAGRLKPAHTPSSVSITGPLSLDDLRTVHPGF